jgi:hypothetical protein
VKDLFAEASVLI